MASRVRGTTSLAILLAIGLLGAYALVRLNLSAFVSAMLLIALFNTNIGALEARWRTYAWRTPDAAKQMGWPEPVRPEDSNVLKSLIVPARHEAAHIGATIKGLLDTTDSNYQIIVSLCTDDKATINAVQNVIRDDSRAYRRVWIIHKLYERPKKPRQLNHALEFLKEQAAANPGDTRRHYVGVIDAEDIVHSGLLLRVEALINQTNADIIQGGVQLMNVGSKLSQWFQVHNVMEYYAWFSSRMQYQAEAGFVPLGGNTVFIKYDLLVRAGGWPLSLTEDCALGVKLCTQFGATVATAYEAEFATREEAPATIFNKALGSLFFQRVRWNQGFFRELLEGEWFKMATPRQKFLAGYILATPFLQALSALLIPVALVTAFTLKLPMLVTLTMFVPFIPIGVSIATQLLGLREFSRTYEVPVRFWHYGSLVVMAWPYQIILGACAVYAAIRHLRGDDSWYKTGRAGIHQIAVEGAAA